MTKTEAIAWLEVMKEDAIFEQYDALKMAIEALQTAEINCVHCPRYYETEDDIGVHSHCGSHGRLIDADALMEYCSNQKSKTISNNDIARFPTVQIADRPHGEWILECYSEGEGVMINDKGRGNTNIIDKRLEWYVVWLHKWIYRSVRHGDRGIARRTNTRQID